MAYNKTLVYGWTNKAHVAWTFEVVTVHFTILDLLVLIIFFSSTLDVCRIAELIGAWLLFMSLCNFILKIQRPEPISQKQFFVHRICAFDTQFQVNMIVRLT